MKKAGAGLASMVFFGLCAWMAFSPSFRSQGPGAMAASCAAALPAGLLVCCLLRHLDRLNPKSRGVFAFTLAWGGLVCSAFMSYANGFFHLAVERAVRGWGEGSGPAEAFGRLSTALLSAPLGEELLKGLAVAALLLWRPRSVLGLWDGMILGAWTGAAFAVAENLLYFSQAFGADGWWILIARRSTQSLALHVLCSMIFGAFVGLASLRPTVSIRLAWILTGWLAAAFWHGLSNGLKIFPQQGGLVAFWAVSALLAGGLIAAATLEWREVRNRLATRGMRVGFFKLPADAGRWALWQRWLQTTEPTDGEREWADLLDRRCFAGARGAPGQGG